VSDSKSFNESAEKTGAAAHGYQSGDVSLIAEGGSPGLHSRQLSRRQALQWVMAVAAASSLPGSVYSNAAPTVPVTAIKGYGVDPDLVQIHKPGSLWPLTFTPEQRKTAIALADVILPKDEYGPAASEVGVIALLDEWISAPYPTQQADRSVILDGLAWLDSESANRFQKPFADVPIEEKHAICDDIRHSHTAKPAFKKAAGFFNRFRWLSAAAYYGTPEGWKAIGYVGNVPLPKFDGPPQEVLDKLGVTQTVG
jgi:hypothetical protein